MKAENNNLEFDYEGMQALYEVSYLDLFFSKRRLKSGMRSPKILMRNISPRKKGEKRIERIGGIEAGSIRKETEIIESQENLEEIGNQGNTEEIGIESTGGTGTEMTEIENIDIKIEAVETG